MGDGEKDRPSFLQGQHPDAAGKKGVPECPTGKGTGPGTGGEGMTRGPPPVFGLDAAVPVARTRGRVMLFEHSPGNTGDFLITGNGCVALVRVRKARRLHGTLEEIEADFHDAVTLLRTVPSGGPLSRELWLYSRYGVLRFFRVGDAGLTELCPDGKVLVPAPGGPAPAGPAVSPAGASLHAGEEYSLPKPVSSGGST